MVADDWFLANIQQNGFYRVNYDNENWARLSQQLVDNHLVRWRYSGMLIIPKVQSSRFRKGYRILFRFRNYVFSELRNFGVTKLWTKMKPSKLWTFWKNICYRYGLMGHFVVVFIYFVCFIFGIMNLLSLSTFWTLSNFRNYEPSFIFKITKPFFLGIMNQTKNKTSNQIFFKNYRYC